jgi:hypothetical protein
MSKQEPSPPTKKPYRTPVLETYGAIKDLTRAITGTGKNDSMSGNTTKTG